MPPTYNPAAPSYSPTSTPSYPPPASQPASYASQPSSTPTSLAGVDLSSLPLMTGTVRWFNPAKGYGFIAPSDGSPHDAFVHQNQLQSDGFRALDREQLVEFRMRVDPQSGKHIALAVTAPGGGKLPAGRREEDRESGGFRDRGVDGGSRGPPPFRPPPDSYPPATASSAAEMDARAPPYDGRNVRPAGMPFCVGAVKSFDAGKGFGFLTQLSTASGQPGAGDIFVHQTNVHMEGRRELVEGMMLEYVEGADERNGKPLAKYVTGRNGSLITRADVEAAMQQKRPHPGAHPAYAQQPPLSPHKAQPSNGRDPRTDYAGSRDSDLNGGGGGGMRSAGGGAWLRGTVLTFDAVKKYGFIKPDGVGENMFLHATRSDIPTEELSKGMTLEYQVGVDQKGKECAVSVRRPVGGQGGYGPMGRQRSPHRAAAPYGRDARGASPVRARYEGYDGRGDGYDRDRGEYRRGGYDRRTPPRDYVPPRPAAYPPPPASVYPPPPAAQQAPPPAAAGYYDPYRADPRYAQPPAASAPGVYPPPPPQPASAPAAYDPHYPPPPASYYAQPNASVSQAPNTAPAQNAYYGQHATPPYYYPPPPAAASAAPPAHPQYAYAPPSAAAAPTVPPPAASVASPPNTASTAPASDASNQPNQMLAHLYSLYSTLSSTTAAPQASAHTAPAVPAPAAPTSYQYAPQPAANHRPY